MLSEIAEYYQHYSLLELFMWPEVLIQHGSYLQRCRSRCACSCYCDPPACRQILAPTLAAAGLFFLCKKIQII